MLRESVQKHRFRQRPRLRIVGARRHAGEDRKIARRQTHEVTICPEVGFESTPVPYHARVFRDPTPGRAIGHDVSEFSAANYSWICEVLGDPRQITECISCVYRPRQGSGWGMNFVKAPALTVDMLQSNAS